ncbi:MAG TPA: ribosomal-processing cysteine protease Prp [Candidatus Acidoferrum sp.]|nr:ribosomal-processing cysteine protease Prp [Candidatus Acidoferrum sp.]
MIAVTVGETQGKKRLAMTGHANYSGGGDDIVCAACSALVFALFAWLEQHPKSFFSIEELSCDKGEVVICAAGDAAFAAAFDMAVAGLAEIEKKYPEHLRIKHI